MTDAELDQCRRDGVLLRSIISQQVKLKRAGRDWKGCCPFHEDNTPSFTVFGDGHFHCFGCGAHGTVFDFVMLRDGIEFPEAAGRVAAERGLATPKPRKNGNGGHHAEVWQPIVPPSADAPKPTEAQLRCDMLHEYHDTNDRLLFFIRRIEAQGDQRKQFIPLTYGTLAKNGRTTTGWHARAPDAPRPLYGLNRLSHAAAGATVILCEGEKAADAAQRQFPDAVGMAWPGGANADGDADFSPLKGREVILWPDADKPGVAVMDRIAKYLPQARIIDTADLPDGYDAADLERDDVDDPEAWLNARLPSDPYAGLATELSVSTWLSRVLPPVDRLLGDFVTTTSRAFLVGHTGLGKTMLGLGFAMGMGFGSGFLHWRSSRPARVLFIDGEMPGELLIHRIRDAARRIGREDMIDNVMVFSIEDAEDIAERYPMLGMFEPLNTEGGQDFLKRLCAALKPDAVILDNVQALLVGVQKEEETWIPVLPLVQWLTKQRIGQLWIDHTARSTGMQYGTSTKSWRFDTVGLMLPVPDEEREPRETAFTLSFEKARRRTPDNWDEFASHIIRLRDDVWTSEPVGKLNDSGGTLGNVPPSRTVFYEALISAIGRKGERGRIPLSVWESEAQRRGLIEPPADDETSGQRAARFRDFRKAKSVLLAAKWIAIQEDTVIDLKARWA